MNYFILVVKLLIKGTNVYLCYNNVTIINLPKYYLNYNDLETFQRVQHDTNLPGCDAHRSSALRSKINFLSITWLAQPMALLEHSVWVYVCIFVVRMWRVSVCKGKKGGGFGKSCVFV